MRRTEKVVEIHAPVERVFDLFSDFESFPRWMSHIKDVRYTGRRYTRWTAEAPLGSSVEWEAETTRFEPDRLIAWRSVRGDVETEGEVIFQETERGTTLVRVMLGYDPPAGRLGALVARLFGTNPEEQLEEDLARFAEVVEGRRHRGLERSRRDFDDDGPSRRSNRRGFEREARGYAEGARARRREDEEDERRDRRSERPSPRERQKRFAQEVDEALRSQRESMRRYNEERRNHKLRRLREEYERELDRTGPPPPRTGERAPARAPAEERRLYERRMRERAPRRGEDDRRPAPPRHALTPRERELDRARRKLDLEYTERAFHRGVDKLLDDQDAPSSRWRRW